MKSGTSLALKGYDDDLRSLYLLASPRAMTTDSLYGATAQHDE